MEGASSGRTKRRSRKKDFSTALEMTKRSTQHQEASDTKMPFHDPNRSRPPIRNPGSATFHCIGRLFRSRPFWQSVWGGLKRAAGAPADFGFHRPRAFPTPCEHDERRMTPEPPPPARPPRNDGKAQPGGRFLGCARNDKRCARNDKTPSYSPFRYLSQKALFSAWKWAPW